MAAFEGYAGQDYVVTNKKLSGNNVTTLIGGSKVSFNKTSVKKGSSIKANVKLSSGLVAKPKFKSDVPYGKQAAVVTYKSSSSKIATVSKNGKVKAKSKGKAVITVKIKLADGKTKTVKKTITVK
ncbi:MAG: Ig-like domain-containing protein [Lachnospiraceae bacterium]